MENYEKTTVFPNGYDQTGEIPHGRLWPDIYIMCDVVL